MNLMAKPIHARNVIAQVYKQTYTNVQQLLPNSRRI